MDVPEDTFAMSVDQWLYVPTTQHTSRGEEVWIVPSEREID